MRCDAMQALLRGLGAKPLPHAAEMDRCAQRTEYYLLEKDKGR